VRYNALFFFSKTKYTCTWQQVYYNHSLLYLIDIAVLCENWRVGRSVCDAVELERHHVAAVRAHVFIEQQG